MKKRWKIFWIVCGSMLAAGIVLVAAGQIMGATMEQTIAGIAENAAVGDASLSSVADEKKQKIANKVSEHLEYQYGERASDPDTRESYQGIREIDIDVSGVAVQILTSEDDDVHVETKGLSKKCRHTCRQDEEQLEIDTDASLRTLNRLKGSGTIWVYVPQRQLNELEIANEAGVVYVGQLNAADFSLDMGAGEAKLKDFTVQTMEIDCGVGSIDGKGTASAELDVDCGVGDVSLTLCGNPEDYARSVSCGLGDVKIDGRSYSGAAVTDDDDVEEDGDHDEEDDSDGPGNDSADHGSRGQAILSVECGVGSVEISFEE